MAHFQFRPGMPCSIFPITCYLYLTSHRCLEIISPRHHKVSLGIEYSIIGINILYDMMSIYIIIVVISPRAQSEKNHIAFIYMNSLGFSEECGWVGAVIIAGTTYFCRVNWSIDTTGKTITFMGQIVVLDICCSLYEQLYPINVSCSSSCRRCILQQTNLGRNIHITGMRSNPHFYCVGAWSSIMI